MRIVVIAILMFSSIASVDAQAAFPSSYIDSVLVEQVRKAHIDYPREYAAAMRGDSAGIHALFRASHSTDGVGADRHSTVLAELLTRLGDARYAAALRIEPAITVRAVRCALDYAAEASWSQEYPLTAALSPADPNCVGGHSLTMLGADGRARVAGVRPRFDVRRVHRGRTPAFYWNGRSTS